MSIPHQKTPVVAGLPRTLRALCASRLMSALDAASKAHAAKQHRKQAPGAPCSVAQDPLEALGGFVEGLVNAKGVVLVPPYADAQGGGEGAVAAWRGLQELRIQCGGAGGCHGMRYGVLGRWCLLCTATRMTTMCDMHTPA